MFGPWAELAGTLAAARARAELMDGFAPGGCWVKRSPGPELATARIRENDLPFLGVPRHGDLPDEWFP